MHAAQNEVAEECDVHVGDVVVADPTVSSVLDVVFRQQVLLVQIPLRPVSRRAFAAPPVFRQRELVVGVDDLHNRLVEALLRDVAQVQLGDLLAAQALDGSGRLTGPQVAAVAKQRADEAFARVVVRTGYIQRSITSAP